MVGKKALGIQQASPAKKQRKQKRMGLKKDTKIKNDSRKRKQDEHTKRKLFISCLRLWP